MAKQLATDPESLIYNHAQEATLKEQLVGLDRSAVLYPISSIKDVTLDSDAKLFVAGDKYTLTSWALYQICQWICPSLHGFVVEMSGMNRLPDEDRGDYSFDEALSIFNSVVRRRFRTRLCGKNLLRNAQTKTIDGVISSGYKWLSNLELYERSKAAMTTTAPSAVFFEAVLNGRWLMLRYVHTKPVLTTCLVDDKEEKFYTGYHFSNNEVGRAAVRAASFLYRKWGHTFAISPTKQKATHLRHQGKGFSDRLDTMIKSVMNRFGSDVYYFEQLKQLEVASLGLGNKDSKVEVRRAEDIVATLAQYKLPAGIGRKALGSVMTQASYEDGPEVLFRPVDRSVYDLYNALGRTAKDLPIGQREVTEQVAYQILIGKIKF